MNLENYLIEIQEGNVFSKKPLIYKFEEWKYNKDSKLFIVGDSGSGKTTYAYE